MFALALPSFPVSSQLLSANLDQFNSVTSMGAAAGFAPSAGYFRSGGVLARCGTLTTNLCVLDTDCVFVFDNSVMALGRVPSSQTCCADKKDWRDPENGASCDSWIERSCDIQYEGRIVFHT